MKINVEIDCTPEEARAFLGLPDLQPLHEAWVREMEAKIHEAAQGLTTEAMMQSWMQGAQANMEWLPRILAGLAQGRDKG